MNNRELIQKECSIEISKHKRCTAAISVGVGKTLIGLQRIVKGLQKNSNPKILVVAPKKSIFQTWKTEADKHNLTYLLNYITFSTYLSLNKQDLDYDFLILDEIHSLKYSHRVWLSMYRNGILGLTGTPPSFKKGEKYKMIDRYAPIVYEYIVDEAIDDGILNDYQIHVHYLELSSEKNILIKTPKYEFYTSEISSYEHSCKSIDKAIEDFDRKKEKFARLMRMQGMKKFKSKEEYAKKLVDSIKEQSIVFANTIDQAERISLYSYNSKNKASEEYLEMFKNNKIKVLSCVEQLSEGVNIPNLKNGIILHTYSGESPKSRQKFGRLMRLPTNQKCNLHLLVYKGTIDEDWADSVLKKFDETKIKRIEQC